MYSMCEGFVKDINVPSLILSKNVINKQSFKDFFNALVQSRTLISINNILLVFSMIGFLQNYIVR